jgi:hypothetical protein
MLLSHVSIVAVSAATGSTRRRSSSSVAFTDVAADQLEFSLVSNLSSSCRVQDVTFPNACGWTWHALLVPMLDNCPHFRTALGEHDQQTKLAMNVGHIQES